MNQKPRNEILELLREYYENHADANKCCCENEGNGSGWVLCFDCRVGEALKKTEGQ